MDSIPKSARDEPRIVQGFIIYKLWMLKCWARGGQQHAKHIDLENDLPTNYPAQFRTNVLHEAEELNRNGLIRIWPSSGRKAVAAVPSKPALEAALPLVNAYLKAVGEDPIEGDIREVISGKRSERKGPLSNEELRKFARMHRQRDRSRNPEN